MLHLAHHMPPNPHTHTHTLHATLAKLSHAKDIRSTDSSKNAEEELMPGLKTPQI